MKETPEKKRKLNDSEHNESCHPLVLPDFKGFSVQKILSQNFMQKRVTVHAKFAEEDAVVMLEKTPFDLAHMERYFTEETSLKNTLKNDIYGTYQAYPPPVENGNYWQNLLPNGEPKCRQVKCEIALGSSVMESKALQFHKTAGTMMSSLWKFRPNANS